MMNIDWLLVLIVIAYIVMVVFTACVTIGLACDFDIGSFLLSLLWPIFWAFLIVVVVFNPLCKLGIRIGRWIDENLVED